jgi:hypothetical protein
VVSAAFDGDAVVPSMVEGCLEATTANVDATSDGTAGFELTSPVAYDNSKMRELGVTEVAMEDSVVASVEALSRLGHIALSRRRVRRRRDGPEARL